MVETTVYAFLRARELERVDQHALFSRYEPDMVYQPEMARDDLLEHQPEPI